MSNQNENNLERKTQAQQSRGEESPSIFVDINAAYNREGLTLPKPNGPNGRYVLSIEMLMRHSFYWEWMNEHETEEVLMKLYKARTRHTQ